MRKKILAMLLAAVLAVSLLPGAAWAEDAPTSGTCGENLTWALEDGVLTIKGTGPMDDYHRDFSFLVPWYNYKIHTVMIDDGVTAIGEYAFTYYNSITSVTIPGSVTSIGQYAFAYCRSLTGVTIPDGVTTIEYSAFEGCESLTSVTIPASVASIWHGAFICENLKDVYYGGSESQWDQISIEWGNGSLTDAEIHYNSTGPDTAGPAEPEPAEPMPAAPEPTVPAAPEPEIPAVTFSDVPAGAWYADAVAWAVTGSITTGTGNGEFTPGRTCSHGEIITFLWRAAGNPPSSVQAPVTTEPHDDFRSAANWAYEKGIIGADFRTSAPCTRADTVTYMWKAAGSPSAPAGTGSFPDVTADAACAGAVAWAVGKGVTTGTDNGTFEPGATCDRSQIVTFLYRAYAN